MENKFPGDHNNTMNQVHKWAHDVLSGYLNMNQDVLAFRAFKVTCAIIASIWYSFHETTQWLLIFLLLDYATGFLAARKHNVVSSSKGWWGIVKKLGTVVVLGIGHFLGIQFNEPKVGTTFALLLCYNECVSVIENLAKLGTWIPGPIMKSLLYLRGRNIPGLPTEEVK